MRILAIDPGLTMTHPMGWASFDGHKVRSGSVCFHERASDHRGVRLSRLRMWLETTMATLRPHVVVYEVPTPRGRGQAAITQLGTVALIDMAACDVGADIMWWKPSQLKKWATGHGHADKAAMLLACREMYGFTPERDDEADALLLLEWARETLEEANDA